MIISLYVILLWSLACKVQLCTVVYITTSNDYYRSLSEDLLQIQSATVALILAKSQVTYSMNIYPSIAGCQQAGRHSVLLKNSKEKY